MVQKHHTDLVYVNVHAIVKFGELQTTNLTHYPIHGILFH